MPRTKASRKYQITVNNPAQHHFDHDQIKAVIESMTGCVYWCMCDEIGEQGTYHTHLYMAFENAKEFQSIHRRFYGAHIELAKGTHGQNRDYIRKEGAYQDSEKATTNLKETFEEWGELPEESQPKEKQSSAVLRLIEQGATNAEILREYPSTMNHLPRIDQARQALLEERYRKEFRMLDVSYVWGTAGSGKTRGILERHGYEAVYRVTDYLHPFDGYQGEDVLLLDEFRSSLSFSLVLNVLDGYPLMLPCRFANRVACYTKVYLVSNISLDKQYPNIQLEEPESYRAFLRRIHHQENMLTPIPSDSWVPF